MCVRCFLLFGLALMFFGCSESTPDVTGTVTLDDQPLAEGTIVFESEDGKTPAASGTISSGKYSLKVAPGPKTVRILATKASDKVDPAMGGAPKVSIIPAVYNSQSTLKADVKAGKNNPFDFPLKSKP
jgi:hypothetical protein